MNSIKIIIVDDVIMTRFGFSEMLRKIGGFEVIAEAENGKLFLELLQSHKPDVVLMDIKMPVMDGLEATKHAMNTNPNLKIIALTNDDTESTIDKMMLSGAKGFLLKSVTPVELKKAIDTVIKGGYYFSDELAASYKLKNKK